jgi:competence protein ComEA
MKSHCLKIVVAHILTVVIFIILLSGCKRENRKTIVESPVVSARENTIDINTASEKELQTLPGIGETLAKRIIEFRERNGRFRRPEHLLLVPGVSEKRFHEIRSLIQADQIASHD